MVEADTRLSVPDNFQVADVVFQDDEPHAPAYWSVAEIMAHSSNVGTIMIGQRLGKDRIDKYLRAFGLADADRPRLPGRVGRHPARPRRLVGHVDRHHPHRPGRGRHRRCRCWAPTTPSPTAAPTWPPAWCRATVDAAGQAARSPTSAKGHRVVSEETAAAVTQMLVGAVAEGTGTAAAIDGLHRGRQDRHRPQARGQRPRLQGRRLHGQLRRLRPRRRPPPVGHRRARRAHAHLRRPGRRPPCSPGWRAAGTRLFAIPPQPTGDAPLSSSSDRDLAAGRAGTGMAGTGSGGRYARAFAHESLTLHVRLDRLLGRRRGAATSGATRTGAEVVAITPRLAGRRARLPVLLRPGAGAPTATTSPPRPWPPAPSPCCASGSLDASTCPRSSWPTCRAAMARCRGRPPRPPVPAAGGGRRHRHQRQDDHHPPAQGRPRGRRPAGRGHRHPVRAPAPPPRPPSSRPRLAAAGRPGGRRPSPWRCRRTPWPSTGSTPSGSRSPSSPT